MDIKKDKHFLSLLQKAQDSAITEASQLEEEEYQRLKVEVYEMADIYVNDPEGEAGQKAFNEIVFDLSMPLKYTLFHQRIAELTRKSEAERIRIIPSAVNTLRYPTTKLSLTLLESPIQSIEGVNVATKTDIDAGMNYMTYFNIIEDTNIKLPENFEFTSKVARYIDVVGSILEDPVAREHGGIIKVRHFINTMNGKDAAPVRDEKIEEVINDLNTLATIRIEIDARGHQDYNALKKNTHKISVPYYSDYLLATRIMMIDDDYYMQMLTFPPLYEYAKETGQMRTYPKYMIDLTRVHTVDELGTIIKEEKTEITKTSERYENIRDFFLRGELNRLEQMKKKSNNRNAYIDILYSRLYGFLEKQDPALNVSKRKGTIDEQIRKVLQVLKDKGAITNFDCDISKGKQKKYKIRIM